jgi:hypothetical protein
MPSLTQIFSVVMQLLEKVLNWASPYFLGRTLEKSKWEKGTQDEINKTTETRKKISRDVVRSSDDVGPRDKLRLWARRGEKE